MSAHGEQIHGKAAPPGGKEIPEASHNKGIHEIPLGIPRCPWNERVPKVPPSPEHSMIFLNLIPISRVKFQGSAPSQSLAFLVASPLVPLDPFSTGNWGWNFPKSSLEALEAPLSLLWQKKDREIGKAKKEKAQTSISTRFSSGKRTWNPWMFSLGDGLCLTPKRKISCKKNPFFPWESGNIPWFWSSFPV